MSFSAVLVTVTGLEPGATLPALEWTPPDGATPVAVAAAIPPQGG